MSEPYYDYYQRLDDVSLKIMRRLTHQVSRILDEGITSAQFLVMRLVARHDSMTVSQIAEILGVTLSAVTLLSDRLETGGWLSRDRHPQDRRLVVLTLTDAGRQKLADLESKRIRMLHRYMSQMTESERDQMLALMEKLSFLLEQTDLDEK